MARTKQEQDKRVLLLSGDDPSTLLFREPKIRKGICASNCYTSGSPTRVTRPSQCRPVARISQGCGFLFGGQVDLKPKGGGVSFLKNLDLKKWPGLVLVLVPDLWAMAGENGTVFFNNWPPS